MDATKITVLRYITPEGKPTCCRDWLSGQTCRFLHVSNLGSLIECALHRAEVFRDLESAGRYLKPVETCEVWQ